MQFFSKCVLWILPEVDVYKEREPREHRLHLCLCLHRWCDSLHTEPSLSQRTSRIPLVLTGVIVYPRWTHARTHAGTRTRTLVTLGLLLTPSQAER